MHGRVRVVHSDEMRRKLLIMALIAIILGTAVGRIIGTVTHNASLRFVAVIVLELLSFSLITL
jgi:hypothetical protein